jgi:UDP-2-acetamido-2-deoxy-ribo-hexuluronate aminotransferase
VPIHLQEAWRNYGGENYSLPVTESTVKEILSLPMYPELTGEEINYICECIRKFYYSRKELVGQKI